MLTRQFSVLLVTLAAWLVLAPAFAGAPKPAFMLDSVMETYFDDESGLIAFGDFNVAFAPDEPFQAVVAVTDSKGTVVQSFPFSETYRYREGVFARAHVEGGSVNLTLTEPGVYNIVFLINGELATRLPVVLEQTSAGDDPFDPVKTYRYYGLWGAYAYFTTETFKDVEYPEISFWVGGRDLAEGTTKDMFTATLTRDGEVVGHSKRTLGHINAGHYERVETNIYQPHTDRQTANAQFVPLSDWTKDGSYELVITRRADNAVIRRFAFTAKDGVIQGLPNVALGFEPRVDFVVPRVPDRGTQVYDFIEATWIRVAQ